MTESMQTNVERVFDGFDPEMRRPVVVRRDWYFY